MRVRLSDTLPPGAETRCIAFLHEGADPSAGVPAAVRARLRPAVKAAGFRGKAGEIAEEGGWTLCGLGRAPAPASRLRSVLRRAAKSALRQPRRTVALCFDEGVSEPAFRSLLPHIALADYSFDRYKSKKKEPAGEGQAVVVPPPGHTARFFARALREAEAVATAVRWVRDAGNAPGNDLGPLELALEARALAARGRFRLKVLGRREIEKEKMAGRCPR